MNGNARKLFTFIVMMLTVVFMLCGCSGGDGTEAASWPAMDALSAVDAGDITSVSYTRSTEAGAESGTAADPMTVEDIYLRLCKVSIQSKTDAAVDDDGLSIKVETGGKTLGFEFEGNLLVMEDGSSYEVDNLDSLKSYIDGILAENGSGTETGTETGTEIGTQTQGNNTGSGSSGDFDILAGFQVQKSGGVQYVYGNDFLLIMPDGKGWALERTGMDSFLIYLKAARESGYGGDLVTIKAYDMDDNSYTNLPSYSVAGVGRNVNKRFVAIFPTDVRWDGSDAEQDANYRDLSDYLHKIGEGAVNSPFQTADSD